MRDRLSLLRTNTVARNLALGMALTIALVAAFVGSINYQYSVTTQQRALEREADDLLERLTYTLSQPLWNVNAATVRQIGQVYASRETVARLYIVNEDSTIVFEEDAGLPSADLVVRAAPVYFREHEVGRVQIALSKTSIHAENARYLGVLLLFGLLITIAVVSVNYQLLQHYLSRPLAALTNSLKRVADGDYSQRIPERGLTDLDAIANAVNQMAAAVEERDQQLHRANEELESRVEQRTARLQKANERLEVEVEERTRAEASLASLTQELAVRNEELKEKNAELELRNAEMERFTYTVSHDLKSPLVTIKGFLGLIEKDVKTGNVESLAHNIQRIHAAADHMHQLLADLLELSRVGRLANPPEPVSVRALVDDALDRTAGRVAAACASVDVPPVMPLVWGDRARLVEVFQNLIDNAAKFMGDQPQPRIVLSARREGDRVLCTVHDNGVGIAPRFHENIFGLFNRLDPTIEGTGIGLTLVKRIIEVHGGHIWVESEGEGHGTSFHFSLSAPPATSHR